MVNHIAPGMNSLPQAYIAADFDRPPAQPEAAVVVTPSSETQSSGSSTTGTTTRPHDPDKVTDTQNSLEKALEAVNSSMQAWSTGMRFEVDSEAQRVVVSIIDSKSGDVLRTVPSEAVIRVAKMIVKLQGTSIDTKA